MWTLISATPSPYARKVRIALQEKGIPFELQTEVPWNSSTKTKDFNPLEKLPVLVLDDGKTAIYESDYILEWLEAKYQDPPLLPTTLDDRLFARKVEVICDGVCDALVLAFFEKARDQDKQSEPWKARKVIWQMRKVDGGIQALASFVDQSDGRDFLIGNKLTLADIAIGSLLGWFSLRWPDYDWQTEYPNLKKYWERLDQRDTFANTRPSPQTITDKVV